jgi:predicted kinase
VVLVGGLPGTGKTTLAEELARVAGFRVISTDRVRKELAGFDPQTGAAAAFGEGIYTAEWNDRTYAACLDKAERLVFEGERVIIDASFKEEKRRSDFRDAAVEWGVRSLFLVCQADAQVVRRRLAARRGGASDADWAIHRAVAEAWESGVPHDARWEQLVPTGGSREAAVAAALGHLRLVGLAEP